MVQVESYSIGGVLWYMWSPMVYVESYGTGRVLWYIQCGVPWYRWHGSLGLLLQYIHINLFKGLNRPLESSLRELHSGH